MTIDASFDFRTDATTDDPDQSSPTLRRYHQLLWGKPLQSVHCLHLDISTAWLTAPLSRAGHTTFAASLQATALRKA